MTEVTTTTEQLVLPILEELSLELVDIEYVKEGESYYLRIFVDKEGGIDIEECGIVSEKLGEKLDEADPIPFPYFLEVASPGAERPLKKEKDFEKAIGKTVHIKTYEAIDGEKTFEGTLTSFDGSVLKVSHRVKTRMKEVDIPFDKVAKARLAVSFG
ncbi:ribosome maturation factor RimP [Bacillus fonticola]|uniref:ribosome maturation factor RimP n=1 Tax=Bacillus fonticola TaxID=2728853 RepID=UPI00147649E6|nr:ribosome maturation factor RimP [Bacillus fonticola]